MTELDPAMREAERWRGEVKKWYDRAIRQSESRQEAELRCVELQAEAEQLRAELRALDAETTERFERACQQRDEAREEAERLRKRVAKEVHHDPLVLRSR